MIAMAFPITVETTVEVIISGYRPWRKETYLEHNGSSSRLLQKNTGISILNIY
jgi:hypothetical protein